MQLTLTSKEVNNSPRFINWLVKRIRFEILASIKPDKLLLLAAYFSTEYNLKDFDIVSEVGKGCLGLIPEKVGNNFIIHIDKKLKVKDSSILVADLCRFVNFGVSNIEGYPLFTDKFNFVKTHLQQYMSLYIQDRF